MKHDSNCKLHHLAVRLQNNDFNTRRVYADSVFITNMLIRVLFGFLFCFVLSLTVQEPTPDPTTPPTPTAPPTIPPGWAGKPLMTSIIQLKASWIWNTFLCFGWWEWFFFFFSLVPKDQIFIKTHPAYRHHRGRNFSGCVHGFLSALL